MRPGFVCAGGAQKRELGMIMQATIGQTPEAGTSGPIPQGLGRTQAWRHIGSAMRSLARSERAAAALAFALLLTPALPDVFHAATLGTGNEAGSTVDANPPAQGGALAARETYFGGYVGLPWHDRSDVTMVRPGGTDLTLKQLEWYSEPFNFPLYAGVRAVHWRGPVGGMVDFLHDKAVARTGKGAHGRKVTGERAIVAVVETEGTLQGQPAPNPVKLTDVLDRLEFSHGHNMLLPTALLRLGSLMPTVRPYVGFGAGVALPHVEVWPTGEGEAAKTNEYQIGGPAMQFVAGLEIQGARGPFFLEYKFTYAALWTSLTGGKTPAWCNCDIVSDFARQFAAWWRGETPAYGHLSTNLLTHQVVAGAGYRTQPKR